MLQAQSAMHPYFVEELPHEFMLTGRRNVSISHGYQRICTGLCHWDEKDDKHYLCHKTFIEENKSLLTFVHTENDVRNSIIPYFRKKMEREIKAALKDPTKYTTSEDGFIIPNKYTMQKFKDWWSGQRPSALASHYIPGILTKSEKISQKLCQAFKPVYGETMYPKIKDKLELVFTLSLFWNIAKDCTFSVPNCNERPVIPNGSYKFTNSAFLKKLRQYSLSSFECLKKSEYGVCGNCHKVFDDGICYETNCKHLFCQECADNELGLVDCCPVCNSEYEDPVTGIVKTERKLIDKTKKKSQIYFNLYKLKKKSTCLPAIKMQIERLKASIRAILNGEKEENENKGVSGGNDVCCEGNDHSHCTGRGGMNVENSSHSHNSGQNWNDNGMENQSVLSDNGTNICVMSHCNDNNNTNDNSIDSESDGDEDNDCNKCAAHIAKLEQTIFELESKIKAYQQQAQLQQEIQRQLEMKLRRFEQSQQQVQQQQQLSQQQQHQHQHQENQNGITPMSNLGHAMRNLNCDGNPPNSSGGDGGSYIGSRMVNNNFGQLVTGSTNNSISNNSGSNSNYGCVRGSNNYRRTNVEVSSMPYSVEAVPQRLKRVTPRRMVIPNNINVNNVGTTSMNQVRTNLNLNFNMNNQSHPPTIVSTVSSATRTTTTSSRHSSARPTRQNSNPNFNFSLNGHGVSPQATPFHSQLRFESQTPHPQLQCPQNHGSINIGQISPPMSGGSSSGGIGGRGPAQVDVSPTPRIPQINEGNGFGFGSGFGFEGLNNNNNNNSNNNRSNNNLSGMNNFNGKGNGTSSNGDDLGMAQMMFGSQNSAIGGSSFINGLSREATVESLNNMNNNNHSTMRRMPEMKEICSERPMIPNISQTPMNNFSDFGNVNNYNTNDSGFDGLSIIDNVSSIGNSMNSIVNGSTINNISFGNTFSVISDANNFGLMNINSGNSSLLGDNNDTISEFNIGFQ